VLRSVLGRALRLRRRVSTDLALDGADVRKGYFGLGPKLRFFETFSPKKIGKNQRV
jgi:hypothetical protein